MLFSAGPVASIFGLVARSVLLKCVKAIQSSQVPGSSRSEKTINERRTGHKNGATKYLNLLEENMLFLTMADNNDP